MRFTGLGSRILILKSRKELITSPVAASDPIHRERNIISAAENNRIPFPRLNSRVVKFVRIQTTPHHA
jgi:hypothetical protein